MEVEEEASLELPNIGGEGGYFDHDEVGVPADWMCMGAPADWPVRPRGLPENSGYPSPHVNGSIAVTDSDM